ncbi:MFS transporter [Bordetella sp. BOR01]|uniref:MFS transporter n=1 Tax=Bordetella sp. BOR01 TaxID=2854779 RepID=UPI00351D71F3
MIVACGVVAALQVGKAAIAGPILQSDLGLNLDALGWLTGIFAILGVVGGIPTGAIVGNFGSRRMLAAGLLATAAGAALGAASPAYSWLLASRVLEGAGFLFITVAAPSVLQRHDVVQQGDRDTAFSLWSCFMPAGMAIAMLAGPLFDGWRPMWWASCALALLAALAVWAAVPGSGARKAWDWHGMRRDAARVISARGPVLLAVAFAFYSLMFFALFSFLPVLLMERMETTLRTAGLLSALACAANIVGNLAAGYLLSRGMTRPVLLGAASLAMGAAGLGIFLPLLPDTGTFVLCVVFSAVGGLVPATLLSGAPLAAPAASLTPVVLGLVMQGNNLGQIVGPVAVGRAIDAYGWQAAALIVALAALLAAATAVALRDPARTGEPVR